MGFLSSLCPHLFEEYVKRSKEIFEAYKPQLCKFVNFIEIRLKLINLKALKRSEDESINILYTNQEKMENLIIVLSSRMWGVENFIKALIDLNSQKLQWLTEELFKAYSRHLVFKMKTINPLTFCPCFTSNLMDNSTLYKTWLFTLSTVDKYLDEMKCSIDKLSEKVPPIKSVLNYLHRKSLALSPAPITIKTQSFENLDFFSDSDSDSPITEEFKISASVPDLSSSFKNLYSSTISERPSQNISPLVSKMLRIAEEKNKHGDLKVFTSEDDVNETNFEESTSVAYEILGDKIENNDQNVGFATNSTQTYSIYNIEKNLSKSMSSLTDALLIPAFKFKHQEDLKNTDNNSSLRGSTENLESIKNKKNASTDGKKSREKLRKVVKVQPSPRDFIREEIRLKNEKKSSLNVTKKTNETRLSPALYSNYTRGTIDNMHKKK